MERTVRLEAEEARSRSDQEIARIERKGKDILSSRDELRGAVRPLGDAKKPLITAAPETVAIHQQSLDTAASQR